MQPKKLPFFRNETDYLDNLSVSTGFSHLDRPTGGLSAGSLNILASKPARASSYGAVVLTNMVRMSFEQEKKAAVYLSLNLQTEIDLMGQFIRQGLNHPHEIAFADEQEFIDELTMEYVKEHNQVPIIIASRPDGEINNLCKVIKRIYKNYGVRLFVIADLDYLYDATETLAFRMQELRFCIKKLKKLAIKLGIAIVLGGELKDSDNDKPNNRADLYDLKYYGLLKPLVNNYYFVYRDYDSDIFKTDEGLDTENLLEVHVFSKMFGQAVVPLTFFEHSGRLEDKMVTR